jgi:hypothetical protein
VRFLIQRYDSTVLMLTEMAKTANQRVDGRVIFEYEDHNVTLSEVLNADINPSTFQSCEFYALDALISTATWRKTCGMEKASSLLPKALSSSRIVSSMFPESTEKISDSLLQMEKIQAMMERPGKHGRPGESGGNVFICCSQITGRICA